MRVPIRKPGVYTHQKFDPHLTKTKFTELKTELEKLKKVSHPQIVAEVQRLAAMGDFSENTAYQMAKARLRGMNERIAELEHKLSHAVIIKPLKNIKTVQLGNAVNIEIGGEKKTYRILGSSEANPDNNIISHNSPLGSALMGHKVGDTVTIQQAGKAARCTIVTIE